jgi:hypothetical protein
MGCSKLDSDVDLALTTSFGNYIPIANEWEPKLSSLLGSPVRFGQYNSPGTTIIKRYCDRCNVLLFERPEPKHEFRRPTGKL